ncbi:hypothetical protein EGW08_016280 [Elysia chlorotica]|uniref:Uncharacterized protein n=1 Tax=Elysia chlorotica TaxID=188477 RepID=A0A433T310_ELYCH|nr:hypothetical protein EGW08_016280 [Elysia chlorotica]
MKDDFFACDASGNLKTLRLEPDLKLALNVVSTASHATHLKTPASPEVLLSSLYDSFQIPRGSACKKSIFYLPVETEKETDSDKDRDGENNGDRDRDETKTETETEPETETTTQRKTETEMERKTETEKNMETKAEMETETETNRVRTSYLYCPEDSQEKISVDADAAEQCRVVFHLGLTREKGSQLMGWIGAIYTGVFLQAGGLLANTAAAGFPSPSLEFSRDLRKSFH